MERKPPKCIERGERERREREREREREGEREKQQHQQPPPPDARFVAVSRSDKKTIAAAAAGSAITALCL